MFQPPCIDKLQTTIDHAFKLCGGIGLFFSFTEVSVLMHAITCLTKVFMWEVIKVRAVCPYILLSLILSVIYYVQQNGLDLNGGGWSMVVVTLFFMCYSFLACGWLSATATRRIQELIPVLSSNLLHKRSSCIQEGYGFQCVVFIKN